MTSRQKLEHSQMTRPYTSAAIKPQMKKKPQTKKINVENFKEVTHEIEFMFFSDLVSLTIIRCGKLVGYEKYRGLLHT